MRAALIVAAVALAACRPPAPRPIVIENRSSVDTPPQRFRGAITEESLQRMMARRFQRQLDAGTFVADFNGTTADLLVELEAMGIHDLGQLAHIIPPDYDRRAAGDFTTDDPANIPGILRDVFIIHDARRYFERAWQNHWQSLSASNVPMYRAYRVDLRVLVKAGVMSPDAIDASSPPPGP